ncbi:hypothetical protein SCLCIDRAFT_921781 [Scleroderma citrinum Foug A]|uniref:Uncharacterized protein n=1 Tax=Scleroderma citrinum Foug A TaxID=1036808 RepID=A0A0C3DYX3_9AGAM|nr:hypothetical protein SCLCIDRAFT_921781 [Scleroderma citrinum Foug A]
MVVPSESSCGTGLAEISAFATASFHRAVSSGPLVEGGEITFRGKYGTRRTCCTSAAKSDSVKTS